MLKRSSKRLSLVLLVVFATTTLTSATGCSILNAMFGEEVLEDQDVHLPPDDVDIADASDVRDATEDVADSGDTSPLDATDGGGDAELDTNEPDAITVNDTDSGDDLEVGPDADVADVIEDVEPDVFDEPYCADGLFDPRMTPQCEPLTNTGCAGNTNCMWGFFESTFQWRCFNYATGDVAVGETCTGGGAGSDCVPNTICRNLNDDEGLRCRKLCNLEAWPQSTEDTCAPDEFCFADVYRGTIGICARSCDPDEPTSCAEGLECMPVNTSAATFATGRQSCEPNFRCRVPPT